jgi:hypothetical protein
MILSVSRRTDIPAFYAEWFARRVREGFVLVRNPMNRRQVSRISLDPSVVDGIVFWTRMRNSAKAASGFGAKRPGPLAV